MDIMNTENTSHTSISKSLYGRRPVSISNLLSARSSSLQLNDNDNRPLSIISQRSFDTFPTTSVNTPTTANSITVDDDCLNQTQYSSLPSLPGEYPISSSHAFQHHNNKDHQPIASPTSSVYSYSTTSSSQRAPTPTQPLFSSARKLVILPSNERGIRTRVNIVPASAAAAAASSRVAFNHSNITKEQRASSAQGSYGHPYHSARTVDNSRNSGLSGQAEPTRLQSAPIIVDRLMQEQQQQHQQQDQGQEHWANDPTSYGSTKHINAHRLHSSSSASFTRSESPVPYSIDASIRSRSSTTSYLFPKRSTHTYDDDEEGRTYTYGTTSSASASLRATRPSRSATLNEFGSLVTQPSNPESSIGVSQASSSTSLAGSINYLTSPTSYGSLASSSSTHATPPHQHARMDRHDSTSTTAFDPAKQQQYQRPQQQLQNSARHPPRAHLANLPKSLIPGGYDFSPASVNTHDSSIYQHDQNNVSLRQGSPSYTAVSASSPSVPFSMARDRSASVPRTVSVSTIGHESSRSSVDRQQQCMLEPMPELDATFETAKQTLSGDSNASHADDSGSRAARSRTATVSSTRSGPQPADLRQSIDDQDYEAAAAPMLSPIPPKLDLDFGSSTGFSFDFGGTFDSGTFGLNDGSNSSSTGGLNLNFSDFKSSDLPASNFLPSAVVTRNAASPGVASGSLRAKNDSTATAVPASFLSLQESPAASLQRTERQSRADSPLQDHTSTTKISFLDYRLDHSGEGDDLKPRSAETRLKPSAAGRGASTDSVATLSSTSANTKSLTLQAASSQGHAKKAPQPDSILRSESPLSLLSSASLSRPISNLAISQASASSRKRLVDNPAYVGEQTGNGDGDSRRTTVSSTDHLNGTSTSTSSNLSNLPSRGYPSLAADHTVRVSINKSLPPVPPSTSHDSVSHPTSLDVQAGALAPSDSFLKKSNLLPAARDQLGAGRRSYSESHAKYDDIRSKSTSQVNHSVQIAGEMFSATTRTASETRSVKSASSSGFSSLEVTRTFSGPTAPQVTLVYRSSTDSDVVAEDRHARETSTRPRANTSERPNMMKQPCEIGRASKDVPLATLARPKANVRTAWPNGELRKRDSSTEKLLIAACAKLSAWLERHPSREMTLEEAEIHNRAPSASPEPLVNDDQPAISSSSSSQDKVLLYAPSANRDVLSTAGSRGRSSEVTGNSRISLAMGEVCHDENDGNTDKEKNGRAAPLTTSELRRSQCERSSGAADPRTEHQVDHSQQVYNSSGIVASVRVGEQALAIDSNDSHSAPSASVSEESSRNLPRQPAPALSSPKAESNISTTVSLRITPKAHSTAPTGVEHKVGSPAGGEQPWSRHWVDIGEALDNYKGAIKQQRPDRACHCQTALLQTFKNEELAALIHRRALSARQRSLLLDWVDVLFEDLQGTPANRGACLDGIAVVIESRLMSYYAFDGDVTGVKRMERTIAILLAFAVEKLNGKAIFANTLGFAGKMLAAAFWNLEGVALKLLRLLPAVKKQHILRILADTGSAEYPGQFPSHLDSLALNGSVANYMKLFRPVKPGAEGDTYLYENNVSKDTSGKSQDGPQSGSASITKLSIQMSGNWLIRWTATDSDLPFAFIRAYHRQLSNYLPLFSPDDVQALQPAQLVKAPGYAFIASTLLEVCDALIHRNLRSVTTMAPSNNGVNANESANLAAGQKPKGLEVVSKRVIQTIFEIVGGSLQSGNAGSTPSAFASAALRHNFGGSLSMWIRTITRRTSMWDTRGIFALLDLIEGLIYNVCCPPFEEGVDEDEEVWVPSEIGLALFDTKFILGFIKTILAEADNTTCLLRTISFLYTEFQSFTLNPNDREELCDRILLDPQIFTRLFLYYNVGVRGYFLRLLVYRLARLGSSDDGKPVTRDPRIFDTLRLFEQRLEKLRKRHDEIDPLDDWDSDSSDDFRPRPNRFTVSSTWGVHEKPWTMGPDYGGRDESRDSSEDESHPLAAVERVNPVLDDIRETPFESETEATRQPRTDSKKPSRRNSQSSSRSRQAPPSALLSPPMSGNHLIVTSKKVNVAKSAKKVWNVLTNRKSPTSQAPSTHGKLYQQDFMQSPSDSDYSQPKPLEVALTFDTAMTQKDTSSDSSGNHSIDLQGNTPPDSKRKNPLPLRLEKMNDNAPCKAQSSINPHEDLTVRSTGDTVTGGAKDLHLEIPPLSLRKRSSRKSIRRAGAAQTTASNGRLSVAATSPRSRRSSLYSVDLDVETPRSDSFDLPRSPLPAGVNGIVQNASAATGLSATSGAPGILSLSSVTFGALMDGALNFDTGEAGGFGDRLTPSASHKRHKSTSSARRSRPVSVASDRTGPSPRVSKRFSKRASILPPQALDLLREGPSEPVPKIPEQYMSPTSLTGTKSTPGGSALNSAARPPSPDPYALRLHPYAIRGLREYEDCLDEWELFVHRVKEEEGVDGRELATLIPRLQCAWPSTWEE